LSLHNLTDSLMLLFSSLTIVSNQLLFKQKSCNLSQWLSVRTRFRRSSSESAQSTSSYVRDFGIYVDSDVSMKTPYVN